MNLEHSNTFKIYFQSSFFLKFNFCHFKTQKNRQKSGQKLISTWKKSQYHELKKSHQISHEINNTLLLNSKELNNILSNYHERIKCTHRSIGL